MNVVSVCVLPFATRSKGTKTPSLHSWYVLFLHLFSRCINTRNYTGRLSELSIKATANGNQDSQTPCFSIVKHARAFRPQHFRLVKKRKQYQTLKQPLIHTVCCFRILYLSIKQLIQCMDVSAGVTVGVACARALSYAQRAQ